MGHHQATLIIGQITALYTLSSVTLGTSLFLLLISFVGCLHSIFLAAISVLFNVVYFCYVSSLVRVPFLQCRQNRKSGIYMSNLKETTGNKCGF
jgi:hypothetical protein